jgi:hypothetical protein
MYGANYNSYGQNTNINDGGTVISKNSAIESASTKFTDGDDVAHTALTRETTPGFVAPATVIGYTVDASELEQIATASYQLAEGSLCIDAGETSLAPNILFDLSGQSRVSGNQIDIGAYEFDVATSIAGLSQEIGRIIRYKDGQIQITGTGKNESLKIYNINGMLVCQSTTGNGAKLINWNGKGLYLVEIESRVYKLLIP